MESIQENTTPLPHPLLITALRPLHMSAGSITALVAAEDVIRKPHSGIAVFATRALSL